MKACREDKRTRILLLSQGHSLSPFYVDEETFRKILTCHAVSPLLLDILFTVKDKVQFSDEGIGNSFYEVSTRPSRKFGECKKLSYYYVACPFALTGASRDCISFQIRRTSCKRRTTLSLEDKEY